MRLLQRSAFQKWRAAWWAVSLSLCVAALGALGWGGPLVSSDAYAAEDAGEPVDSPDGSASKPDVELPNDPTEQPRESASGPVADEPSKPAAKPAKKHRKNAAGDEDDDDDRPAEELGQLDGERYKPRVREVPFEPDSGPGKIVLVITIEGTIDLGLAPFIDRVVQAANDRTDVVAIVSEIDTPGGRVDAAIQIKDAYLRSNVPTGAWVHSQAISAGALIAYAHDFIYFAPGGTMGAATPIQMGSGGEAQEVGEKVVSFMRGVMRATAEAKERDGDLAEAMVDRSTKISGITTSKKLVTLTDKQALAWGVSDGAAKTLDEVFAHLRLQGAKIERAEPNWAESVARVLTDPTISSILISIGMLGLLLELSTPGFGVAGALGLSALAIFFFGHSVVQLAGAEELALMVVGIIALALELFVFPGFGIAGVIGISAILAALVMMMIGLPLDISWQLGDLSSAIVRVSFSFVITLALAVVFFKFFPRTGPGRRLVLASTLSDDEGFTSFSADHQHRWLGLQGVLTTDLRPAGKAKLDGELVDVVSEGQFLSRGAAVEVVRVEGARVVVRALEQRA